MGGEAAASGIILVLFLNSDIHYILVVFDFHVAEFLVSGKALAPGQNFCRALPVVGRIGESLFIMHSSKTSAPYIEIKGDGLAFVIRPDHHVFSFSLKQELPVPVLNDRQLFHSNFLGIVNMDYHIHAAFQRLVKIHKSARVSIEVIGALRKKIQIKNAASCLRTLLLIFLSADNSGPITDRRTRLMQKEQRIRIETIQVK